jgi:hypothetical protein
MPSADDLRGKFRDEIIESQKMQSEILKWKLIAVAALAAASLGIGAEEKTAKACGEAAKSVSNGSQWLLCLVPLLCAYVDLLSIHYSRRMITLGAYLKSIGDPYETVIFSITLRPGRDPFTFEQNALQGSSIFFNLLLVALGIFVQDFIFVGCTYIIMGLVGVAYTLYLLFQVYPYLRTEIIASINTAKATAAAQAAIDSADESRKAAVASFVALPFAAPFMPAINNEYNAVNFAASECNAAFSTALAAAAGGTAEEAVAACQAAAHAAEHAAKTMDALIAAIGAQPGVTPAVVVALLADLTNLTRTAALEAKAASGAVE